MTQTTANIFRICDRCNANIYRDELYSIQGNRCVANCKACIDQVQGSDYWGKQWSTVCRNGYQVEWSERQDWATAI